LSEEVVVNRLLSLSTVLAANIAVGAGAPSTSLALDLLRAESATAAKLDGVLQLAQTETPATPATATESGAATGEDDPPIEPRATDALIDMGEDLLAMQDFAVRMDATRDQIMDSGQKIQFAGTVIYRVSRPNGLRLDVLTDTGGHQIYYNGKTLTLYTPGKEYYAQVDAKPTIRETIEWMEDTYGIETPLADLFDWGTDRAPFDEIEYAFLVGNSRVNGVLTQHYAFRMKDTDLEVWLETGDRRLPLKFVVTDRTDDSMPQFEATLTWSTTERFDDYIFSYSPSADAQKIPLTSLDDWAKMAKRE
jgi:hypothetical protein